MLEVARGDGEQVQAYGADYPAPDGTAIRDYIHVEDLARAHLLALDAAEGGRHAIYNLSNGQGYSVRQVIETAVKSRSGPSMQPTPLVAPAARPSWSPPAPWPPPTSAGPRGARP